MTDAKKAQILKEAINLLLDAKGLVRRALGDTDVGDSTCEEIQTVADNLKFDVAEFSN